VQVRLIYRFGVAVLCWLVLLARSPETWSTPFIEYGEFEGLRLPARGMAVFKLPDGDVEYFDTTVTGLRYDYDAGTAPEGSTR
jgi:hypothetical protein